MAVNPNDQSGVWGGAFYDENGNPRSGASTPNPGNAYQSNGLLNNGNNPLNADGSPASIPFPTTPSPLQNTSESRTAENNTRAQAAGLLNDLEINNANYQSFGESASSADEQGQIAAAEAAKASARSGQYTPAQQAQITDAENRAKNLYQPLIDQAQGAKDQGLPKSIVSAGQMGGLMNTQFAGVAALLPTQGGTFVGAGGELERIQSAYDKNIAQAVGQMNNAVSDARNAAKAAIESGLDEDYDRASMAYERAKQAFDEGNALARQKVADIAAAQERASTIRKNLREEVSATVENLAKSGIDLTPDEIKDYAQLYNMTPEGFSALYDVTRSEQNLETFGKELEQASKLSETLKSLPAGTPIKIGQSTYYGTQGTGEIEVDPNGNGTMLQVDQGTGAIKVRNLGFVGGQKGDWQMTFDGSGQPYRFSPSTGQMFYMGNTASDTSATGIDMQAIIPEGTSFTGAGGFPGFNGQCGEFCRFVSGVRVGNTLAEKTSKVDKSIGTPQNPVQIGDVLVQNIGGDTGHVAVVTGMKKDPDGNLRLVLSEANVKGDGKITSTRQVLANDPVNVGFIRGNLQPQFQQGTDRPFVPKVEGGTQKEYNGALWNVVGNTATPVLGPDGKQLKVATDQPSAELLATPIPPDKLTAFGIPNNRVGITYGQAQKEGLLTSSGSDTSLKLLGEVIPPEKLKDFGIPADQVGITYGQAKAKGLLTEGVIDSEAKARQINEFAARYSTATTEAERKSVADQAKESNISQSDLMAAANNVPVNKGRIVTSTTGLPADLDPATTKAINTVQLIGNDLARRATELLTENPNLKTGTYNSIVISKLPKEFRSDIQDQLANIAGQMQSQYFFLVSGAQVSPQEEKRLSQSVPNTDATVAQNLQRLKDFKTTMYDIAGRELRTRGLEVSGETIGVKSKKDGKLYHLPISEFNSFDYEIL